MTKINNVADKDIFLKKVALRNLKQYAFGFLALLPFRHYFQDEIIHISPWFIMVLIIVM